MRSCPAQIELAQIEWAQIELAYALKSNAIKRLSQMRSLSKVKCDHALKSSAPSHSSGARLRAQAERTYALKWSALLRLSAQIECASVLKWSALSRCNHALKSTTLMRTNRVGALNEFAYAYTQVDRKIWAQNLSALLRLIWARFHAQFERAFALNSSAHLKYVTLKLKIKFPTHPCFDQFSHPQTYKICAPTDADWQLDSHSDMVWLYDVQVPTNGRCSGIYTPEICRKCEIKWTIFLSRHFLAIRAYSKWLAVGSMVATVSQYILGYLYIFFAMDFCP